MRAALRTAVDRTRREGALALAGAWLAFMAGLSVGGEVGGLGSILIAGAIGAAFVLLGFAAAWRCRGLSGHTETQRVRLAALALVAGAMLGVANLAANLAIAASDPTLRALLAERMARVALAPLNGVVAAPLVEEVGVRLFLMSAIAWLAFRITKRETLAFAVALVGSAVIFAALHLARPLPADPALADFYRATLMVKYTAAGLTLGWIFWRWGLPYAILGHAAANAAHLALQSRWF